MLDIIVNMINVIWQIVQLPLKFFCFVFCLFFVLYLINCLVLWLKGKRLKKSRFLGHKKKSGLFKRLFVEFPRQLAFDTFNKEPDMFSPQGMIVFTGRQGKGKTISLVHYLMQLQAEYLKLKVITNLDYKYQNSELTHWKQLIDYKNGRFGVAVAIDETQNWFSSADSKNFPPEMLEVITQNRKNRRVILGTAQNFYMLAKSLRTQTTEVRECHTFFGCLTFVFRKEPILDTEGNVVEMKNRGSYFFVHNEKLRDSYDTYKCISRFSDTGFVEKKDKNIE